MHTTNKLAKHRLVKGLPKHKFTKDRVCSACVRGKQVKAPFKSIKCVLTIRALGEQTLFVVVNKNSKYTWTLFLKDKLKPSGS